MIERYQNTHGAEQCQKNQRSHAEPSPLPKAITMIMQAFKLDDGAMEEGARCVCITY